MSLQPVSQLSVTTNIPFDINFQALQKTKYEDWYWKFQVGKCYYRLGMFRDAEKMFKSALKQQEMIDVFLHLSRVRAKIPATDRISNLQYVPYVPRLGVGVTLILVIPLSAQFCLDRLEFGRIGQAVRQRCGTSKSKSTQPRSRTRWNTL